MAEPVVGGCEIPSAAVLDPDRVGQRRQFLTAREPFGVALDDHVQPVFPRVRPGGHSYSGGSRKILRFLFFGSVQNTKPPSTHAPMSGVMCGWPSLRTVVSQYNSAAARASLTCCQPTGSVA